MATLTDLSGERSGWTPQASRACAPDVLKTEGGLLRQRGKVLDHSDFNDGTLQGWRQHWDAYKPRPAIGLSSRQNRSGSHHLDISTADQPYDADNLANGSGTYKNMTLPRATGLVSISAWLTATSGIGAQATPAFGQQPGRAWRSFGISIDTQRPDNSSRSFPRLSCIEPNTAGAQSPRWYIRGADGSTIPIPALDGIFSGDNEWKMNWTYVRLTWDLDANVVNGKPTGGYFEAQVNHVRADLRSLGGGAATEPPQVGTQVDDFRAGLNGGLSIERATKWPDLYPAHLHADDIVTTWGDLAA